MTFYMLFFVVQKFMRGLCWRKCYAIFDELRIQKTGADAFSDSWY